MKSYNEMLFFIYVFLTFISVLYATPVDIFLSKKSKIEDDFNALLTSESLYKNLPPLTSYPEGSERTLKPGEIPEYVTRYAPVVHLYSEEKYLPFDIAKYVTNFRPTWRNGTTIPLKNKHIHDPMYVNQTLQLSDLEYLPMSTEEDRVFLSAIREFDNDPEWITGEFNKPNYYDGEIRDAPAVLIVTDKGNGWIDAFWFYFYSFNLGPFVMGFGPFGDHIGDWEHSVTRFYNGEPVMVWMSAHGGGGAYFYDEMEKLSTEQNSDGSSNSYHPVIFSARGTHANYPSTGQHSHDLPYSILSDFTDRGGLWNPTKNFLAYTYTPIDDLKSLDITFANGSHPFREAKYGKWLQYDGAWGNPKLDPSDSRQVWSPFEWKYIDGPTGPLTKNLLRISACQRAKWWNFWNGCNVRKYIQYGKGLFDQEGNNSCGHLYTHIRNKWIQGFIETITWGGWICFLIDLVYG